MPVSYHTVHYRKFENSSNVAEDKLKSLSLEQLIRKAFNSQEDENGKSLFLRPNDRIHEVGGDGGDKVILVNKASDLTSAFYGEMSFVQKSGFQAMMDTKTETVKTSDITDVEIFSFEDKVAPEGLQFVRGMAYWFVMSNHFFFVKTHSMTNDLIQDYFEWLLKTKSKVLSQECLLSFQAQFDKSVVGSDIGDVRALRLRGNSAPIEVTPPVDDLKGARRKLKDYNKKVADRTFRFDQAVSILESMFGKQKTDSLVKSLSPDEALFVDATVKISGRRSEASKEQMKSLANNIADLTDAEVQVQGKDFKIKNGDAILRTNMPFELPHENSNFLDYDNVADQIQELYRRYVKEGQIPA